MYTLEKLKHMSTLIGNESVDGLLASYFINHLNNLKTMTLQKCIKDTGISKASIHRFYTKAGFTSFKNFINVLNDENDIHFPCNLDEYKKKVFHFFEEFNFYNLDISKFINILKNTNTILFYGSVSEILQLSSTFKILRKNNKNVVVLNMWNQEIAKEYIEKLKPNDAFIVVNSSMDMQNFYEMSFNNRYLIDMDKINQFNFHKFFIGEGSSTSYYNFNNIKIPYYDDDLVNVIMDMFDKYIVERFKEDYK